MKNLLALAALALCTFLASCSNQTSSATETNTDTTASVPASKRDSSTASPAGGKKAGAAEIMARQQLPILCYHHIVDRAKNEYEVNISNFKDQLKTFADSGYKTITPEQYYNYLVYGASLPEKPFMLTYDDTDLEQFTIAKPEMDKYGFKGVYYIMTISIGRPRYMSKEQIRQLADEGHIIGSHTWDHSRVDRYKYENTKEIRGKQQIVNDYDLQLADTKKKLEELTGKPVEYFAYPFGLWNPAALPEIEKRGYKMAFQLSTKRDSLQPLYTARRIIVAPTWTSAGLLRTMRSSFK
jgi:peptidoglycan/xylan/chitin deacetylase (PgdA/CDA1 family)